MHRRRALISIAGVMALLGTLVLAQAGTAAADGLATTGRFLAPFSENGDFDAAPPSTIEESMRYPTAVSIAVLPKDGKIVYWNGLQDLENAEQPLPISAADQNPMSKSRQLDLSGPTWKSPGATAFENTGNTPSDMFCADLRVLLDGSVIVAGGTDWARDPVDVSDTTHPILGENGAGGTTELFGAKATRIYKSDSNGGSWTAADFMEYGRWYPSMVTLPNGKIFVAGGVGRLLYNDKFENVRRTETFNPYAEDGTYVPASGSWSDNGLSAETTLPLFARLHVIHDGRIFYGANGQMWGPFGQSYDEALWNFMKFYDPATNSWNDVGLSTPVDEELLNRLGGYGAVSGAAEVVLPFTPDASGAYTSTSILQAGGVLGVSPGTFISTDITRKITIGSDGKVSATSAGTLANKRWYSAGVLGANGDAFVFSGADKDEVICGGCEQSVRQAEMYDVETGKWSTLATMERDRTYHNSAILLPDGRFLIGGQSPINFMYGPGHTDGPDGNPISTSNDFHKNTGLTANNLKDSSFQIFEPPYLFRGPRPEITSNVSGILEWGSTRTITTPNAATVDDAILVHVPSQTHVVDGDARAIVLPIVDRATGSVKVKIPSERGVATPGYYYLFLRQTNPGFSDPTVSKAITVRVGNDEVFGEVEAAAAGAISEPVKAPSVTKPVALEATVAAPASRPAASRKHSRDGLVAVLAAGLVIIAGASLRLRRVRA